MGFKETDFYALLGVDANASPEEIKRAYKQQVFLHHPDRRGSQQRFLEATRAYEILSDSQKRTNYDSSKMNYNPFEYTSHGTMRITRAAMHDFLVRIERAMQKKNGEIL